MALLYMQSMSWKSQKNKNYPYEKQNFWGFKWKDFCLNHCLWFAISETTRSEWRSERNSWTKETKQVVAFFIFDLRQTKLLCIKGGKGA